MLQAEAGGVSHARQARVDANARARLVASTSRFNSPQALRGNIDAAISDLEDREDSPDLIVTRIDEAEFSSKVAEAPLLPTPSPTLEEDDQSVTTTTIDGYATAHSSASASDEFNASPSSSGVTRARPARQPIKRSRVSLMQKQLETDLVKPIDADYLADGLEAGLYYLEPSQGPRPPLARTLASFTRVQPSRSRGAEARHHQIWPELKYYGSKLLVVERDFFLPLGLVREAHDIGITDPIKPSSRMVTSPDSIAVICETAADIRKKPPPYSHLKQNRIVGRKPERAEDDMVCACKPPESSGELGCGDDCMNR
ncbi:hypothetical protein OIV83_001158 [Microbotryomycetes sp. JL201]|nr:hypothetical protein OIV83_001158 [Microbotryomycetes sp. JL201]